MIRFALLWIACAVPAWAVQPEDFEGADIVILGEVHDNPLHHMTQAQAVAVISPTAIVWEMVPAGRAALIDPTLGAEEQGALLDWEESGWPDFSMYHPIIASAPLAVHYGAAVPRADVMGVIEGDLASAFAEPILYGLDLPLPIEEQAKRNQLQFDAHCEMLPPDAIPGFVNVQRLRDATFAQAAIQAWRDTGGPVVVIAGNGHARKDWGMPRFLTRAAPDATVITVGQSEGGADPRWRL